MAEIADYMSWNIENLSSRKSAKDLITGVSVPAWIATLILTMETNVVGIMEVTLGTGAAAARILADTLNITSGSSGKWTCAVSERDVDACDPLAARADKYALLWDTAAVTVADAEIPDLKTAFLDRKPLSWKMANAAGGTVVHCLLWHAPQPKNHLGGDTIGTIADAAAEIAGITGSKNQLVSGDFNYATGSAAVYEPLTKLGFVGVFDGEKTTLSRLATFIKNEQEKKALVFDGEVDDAFLSSAYDNIFLRTVTGTFTAKGVIPFILFQEIQSDPSLALKPSLQIQYAIQAAKIVSDHMPLVLTVNG